MCFFSRADQSETELVDFNGLISLHAGKTVTQITNSDGYTKTYTSEDVIGDGELQQFIITLSEAPLVPTLKHEKSTLAKNGLSEKGQEISLRRVLNRQEEKLQKQKDSILSFA